MFPKSPTRQMYPNQGQQPYTPYPIPQLPPMAQKRKGSLLNSLKTRSNRAFHANGSTLSTNGRTAANDAPATTAPISTTIPIPIPTTIPAAILTTISTIHAATSRANDPPQMYESNETRGGAATTAASSSGIGSFFANLISNPTNMINNIEKVSQVVQSVSPVVEQYGPIMRNLPSIVKILTSGKSTEEDPTENPTEDITEKVEVATPPPPQKKEKEKNSD